MIKKIRVEHLEPGMFVSDLNTPWLRHPFLANHVTIRGARDIDRMLGCRMTEVFIDTERGRDSARALPARAAEAELDERLRRELLEVEEPAGEAPHAAFDTEYRQARDLYAEANLCVQREFGIVARGDRADGESATLMVGDLIASLFRNRDALLIQCRRQDFHQYNLRHSVNVALLSLVLGAELGILDKELLRLGLGALLHDLGNARIPDELIRRRGPLGGPEYEVVKTHSLHGAKLLLEARSVPMDCSAVPLGHHERFDGSGYPRRLEGIKVGKFGLVAAIADVYDAMTTDRPYQRGMTPTRALRKLYGWSGTHFHPVYVQKFIRCLGIYPVGSVVGLDTGETGVVVHQNPGQLLRPWVRLAGAADGSRLPHPRDVDLREAEPGGSGAFTRTVAQVLDPAAAGLEVDAVLAVAGDRATSPVARRPLS